VAGGPRQRGEATFTMTVNGKGAAEGQVTEDSADMLQQFDLKDHLRAGPNEATVEVKGETGLLYQVAGRHFEPYRAGPPAKPVLEAVMDYDRPSLSTKDVLRAKATVRCGGKASPRTASWTWCGPASAAPWPTSRARTTTPPPARPARRARSALNATMPRPSRQVKRSRESI